MENQFKVMEKSFHDEVRASILRIVSALSESSQETFRLMYARNGGKRSVNDAKAMALDSVIAEIPPGKLDWAMQQVQASYEKLSNQAAV